MCSTAAHLRANQVESRPGKPGPRAPLLLNHSYLRANRASRELLCNPIKQKDLAVASLLPMGALGTKCKNPASARSTIRANRAVRQRNARALSLLTVRVLWVDAARRASSAHFSFCTAGQTSQTTQRLSRRQLPKICKIAAHRRRTPNQTRRRSPRSYGSSREGC